MALLNTEAVSFLPGDWRGQLKNWMKDNNCFSSEYVRAGSAKIRLLENLSFGLVDRKARESWRFDRSRVLSEMVACGKTGECQEHKGTKERRYVGHYCNQRKFHLPCAMRYRAGQGIEMKNQYLEVAKAQNLWGFYSWTFTLPSEIRERISKIENPKKILADLRRAVSKTIKECLGINTKTRGIQPGFSIMYHPVSSGDPFRASPHFHSIALPLLVDLKNKIITKYKKRFDHKTVKRIYKKHLDRVLKKYGLDDCIKDQYVVHLRDIELDHASSVNHAFKYNNRSQVEDIIKRIKRVQVDYERFICLLLDKQQEVLIPTIKTKDEILSALEFVLNSSVHSRMSYGFMRVLPKYADLLGIEPDEFEEDENWEKLFDVEFFRSPKTVFVDGKVKTLITIFYRKKDSQDEWRKLKPDELRGERASMSNRKLYKARASNGIH